MKTMYQFGLGLLLIASLLSLPQTTQAVSYTLTLAAQGPGNVNQNPSNATYPSGVTVTITGTPNAGAYFAGWSGDTNSMVNPLNIVMNTNYTITGNFQASATYPLTLTTNGQGTIALNPVASSYASNTTVTATATPAGGWIFTGWTGSAAGPTNPLTFTMNSSNSLTGNFVQPPAFDVQPTGVTNGVGANVGFSSHSVGTAPVAYQWYFNGANVAGATNTTLNFNNVQFASAGSYRVIATNLYGSATSSVALLVVTNGLANPVSVCDEPSLRTAIAAGGWIQFGCSGTITLTNPITINNTVILDGSLVNATISGGGKVRLFTVGSSGSLTISNLTLANGMTNNAGATVVADGGAIYVNAGTLNLVTCTLTNNSAIDHYFNYITDPYPAQGGAIFNNGGNVTLIGTSLSNNVVTGLANASPSAGQGYGGAIYMTNGSLTLINCTLTTNMCWSGTLNSKGGAVCIAAGSASFSNCLFNANLATANGSTGSAVNQINGGAVALLGGNLTINQCQFLNNQAWHPGAYLYLQGVGGGALFCADTASIVNSSFINNQIPESSARGSNPNAKGGAIWNIGNLTLNACCIASNIVWGLDGSFTQGGTPPPSAGLGGGIYNAGQLKMTNCTVALNRSQGGIPYNHSAGYGPDGNAYGAGLCNDSNGVTMLMNVTLANNTSVATNQYLNSGFSAGDQVANLSGALRLHNTLLAYAGTNGNAYGTITDDGYNMSSDGSAAFAGGKSYNLTDPKLGPLADNGGPTLTMSPLAISPAIDTGDASGAPKSDQRGLLRPYGSGYDMGAVEYGSIYPAPSPVYLSLTRNGSNPQLGFAVTATIVYHLQSSTNLTSWINEQSFGPFDYPTNITITPPATSRKFYRVWY